MLTWIRIRWAAFELGVRDGGLAALKWYWNPKLSECEERVPPHSRCGTPLRVGTVKANNYPMHWCYRCKDYVYEEVGEDEYGDSKDAPPALTPTNKVFSLEAKKIANDAFAKMRNPS